MKSTSALPISYTLLTSLTLLPLLAALSGCGQTGPLYMPNKAVGHGAHHGAAATTPPAPAPTSAPIQLSPPSPTAGVTVPAANSNANNSEATNPSPPSTQQ